MNINIRATKEADIGEVLEMMEAFYAIDAYPFSKDITEKNLFAFLNDLNLGRLWMVEFQQKTIGYVVLTFGYSFEFKGRDAFLDELFLKENFRSQGFGSQVVDFVLAQAASLGIQAVHLEAEKHNTKGKKLYKKKGFIPHKRILMTRRI